MKKRRTCPGRNARRRMRRMERMNKRLLSAIQKLRNENSHLVLPISSPPKEERQDFCMIFKSELDALKRMVAVYPDRETGGTLFGHITRTGAMVIDLVTEAGPNSIHSTCNFEPDLAYEETIAGKIINTYAIESIGTFHSHHRLGLSEPSIGDIEMVRRLWTALPPPITRYIMMIATIEGHDVNVIPYLFERDRPSEKPRKLHLFVSETLSPFHGLLKKEHPYGQRAS